MSQRDILELLEKQPDNWFSSKEISNSIGASTAMTSLLKLRRHGAAQFKLERIQMKATNGRSTCFFYKHKP